ncbi:MAG: amidophosphoribosyltransferase [Burkholderiales bacterium RIFCSPLOWO2_02_FULL_57_36]|nr:MAG: amidophosphoribosyltransferase [Burkholderiales bacterium RIFCSPLOWO2_02_FULL_57_36]
MLFSLRHWSRRLIARLPSAIPSSCAICGIHDNSAICSRCRTQFFSQPKHRCRQCAIPLPNKPAGTAAKCGECLSRPPSFDATIVASDYAPPIDRLVLALKFGNQLALAPLFARILRDALLDERQLPLPMLLTAVPLGTRRLAERGFNQALEIGRPLSRALGIALDPHLVARLRDTQAQTLLHPDERHQNIRHAFVVPDGAVARIHGMHIGVVDDVITTGETLNELAATLKRFGAERVTNFVFARTLQK